MTGQEFLVEEYKAVYAEAKDHQSSYRRLESFTFGGIPVVYGFMLTNLVKTPIAVWWVVPFLVVVAATRCSAHYLILNWRFAPYMRRLESEIYQGREFGFQRYLDSSSHRIGRGHNLLFNIAGWLSLIGLCIVAAYWRTKLDVSAVQL